MSKTPPPSDYDFSGLPAARAASEDRVTTPAGRIVALALLPFCGVVALILGAAMMAFADHDIASTASSRATTASADCVLTGTCPEAGTDVASSLVYLSRDIGLGILVTGAVMIGLGIALVIWGLTRRPLRSSEPA